MAGTGVWSGLSVDHDYTHGQRSSRATSLGDIALPTAGYTYQPGTGRMETVTADGVTATYRYNATTGWNEGVTYSGSGGLSSTRTPDALGRLDTISWSAGGNVVSGHDYTLNGMNRRTAAQREDGSQWSYGYNARGEVTSAEKVDAASIPEPGKQFGFEFDGLGNRTSSSVSSLVDDEVTRSTGYTANALNQYEAITHPQPGWLVLRGSVNAEASVSIDGEPPTVRAGPLWHYETEVDNSSGARRRIAEITATRPTGGLYNGAVSTSRKGTVFIPPPSETPTYDWDGNLTSAARWDYTWDGENRLIAAEEKNIAISVAPGATPPTVTTRQRIECTYDSMNRRIRKVVSSFSSADPTWRVTSDLVFLYDSWNMVAEINLKPGTSNLELLRSYEWGLDVSGTMDGAGGVGGLLIERFHSTSTTVNNSQPSSTGVYALCYDGNGNITELVNLANNTLSARYEYGPFGETITVDGGAVAEANPFRFSTKYLDAETGLYNYGYRYYDAANGRWPSRDPIEEQGGISLYGMCGNETVNQWDYLGAFWPAGSQPFPVPDLHPSRTPPPPVASVVWSSISLAVANTHYRTGMGKPVELAFDLINTDKVRVGPDFPLVWKWLDSQRVWLPWSKCKAATKKFTDARYSFLAKDGTGESFKVLGNITLKFVGEVKLNCDCKYTVKGVLKSFDDLYDFNMDWTRPLRSLETIYGNALAGKGVPYWIEIKGSKDINQQGAIDPRL